MSKLRLALAQMNATVGDFAANAGRIRAAIAEAQKLGSDIVAFPELAVCGYPPEDLLLHSGLRSRVEAAFAQVRDEVRGIAVYVGYPEYQNDTIYNSAALLRDSRVRPSTICW